MGYKSCNEADLKKRMLKALQDYPEGDIAAIMWKGYIVGVFTGSRGAITFEEYDYFESIWPKAGGDEAYVYSSGVETLEDRLEALEEYKEDMEWLARRKEQK